MNFTNSPFERMMRSVRERTVTIPAFPADTAGSAAT